MPHWHMSRVAVSGVHRIMHRDGLTEEIYPPSYWPGDTVGDHLEFALKYDGVALPVLAAVFGCAAQEEISTYVASKPTGKYARRVWFFYELITNTKLPLKDLAKGNYIEALDSELYYTVTPARRVRRQRVMNNLLGPSNFCPTVRRTARLEAVDPAALRKRCEELTAAYPPELLARALQYLYRKETKSSFEIEHLRPNASRTERFMSLLASAQEQDFVSKDSLIDLQNRIVDPRFRDSDYRTTQNYVGQSVAYQKEIVHFVSPKPDDLPSLMQGLLESHSWMRGGGVPAVVHAAVVAYGFVFMHPFEDGNGRIHRFLIHNILALKGLVPQGLMFPISAVMLKDMRRYDASLEAFSRPLLRLVDYEIDQAGTMTVGGETACWYRFIDMTAQAEALSEFMDRTVQHELVEELSFLANYDRTKRALQDIVDMPDQRIDLFIRLVTQNNGRLSAKKRASHFGFLSDDEVSRMERAVAGRGQ
ncbi:MAG: cell filamentation protein Fic [Chitinivibrionales bacterium]|nr:cell filamentation protein Fic [Chitinivibrionales bacterium]